MCDPIVSGNSPHASCRWSQRVWPALPPIAKSACTLTASLSVDENAIPAPPAMQAGPRSQKTLSPSVRPLLVIVTKQGADHVKTPTIASKIILRLSQPSQNVVKGAASPREKKFKWTLMIVTRRTSSKMTTDQVLIVYILYSATILYFSCALATGHSWYDSSVLPIHKPLLIESKSPFAPDDALALVLSPFSKLFVPSA